MVREIDDTVEGFSQVQGVTDRVQGFGLRQLDAAMDTQGKRFGFSFASTFPFPVDVRFGVRVILCMI